MSMLKDISSHSIGSCLLSLNVVILCTTIGLIYFIYKISRLVFSKRNYYDSNIQLARARKANAKEDLRKKLSTDDGALFTPERSAILSLSLKELVDQLQCSKISPQSVLQAYQAKAIISDDKTNCIVEFIHDAEGLAEKLDSIVNKRDYPLFGVPLSVKECLAVKNTDSTAGLAKFLFQPSTRDCSLVEAMRNLGAVPFCRTNNPQMLKSFGCSNPIYGNTSNPYNKKLTAGGSSGGEAALIADGGSIIGIGSDVGGSLRVPAHFCGITSIKPTHGRLLENGFRLKKDVQPPFLVCSSGFMTQKVETLIMVHEIFAGEAERFAKKHFSLVPLKWNKALLEKRKLKIGWFEDNNFFEAVPSCRRALQECIQKLSDEGHHLIKIDDPGTPKLVDLVLSTFQSDGGSRIRSIVDERERIDECYRLNYYMAFIPEFIKSSLGYLLFKFIRPSKILRLLSSKKALSASDIWILAGEIQGFMDKVNEEWWNHLELDVVLTPGFAFPAIPNSEVSTYLPAAAFTAPYNILDLPAGNVPFTRVTAEDIENLNGYPYTGDKNEYLFKRLKTKLSETKGCPVGVQVIGRRWQEETVLYTMKEIQDLANFY